MIETLEQSELKTSDGSRAVLRKGSGDDVLETRDRRGRLVFEFHPATGRAILHVPSSLEIEAAGAVCIRGRSVSIEAKEAAMLSTPDAGLRLNRDSASLKASSIRTESDDAVFCAALLQAEGKEIRFTGGRLELAFNRVVVAARDVVQRIENLLHTRAGRVRMVSRMDATIQARTANLVAKSDFRVQGETIHLG